MTKSTPNLPFMSVVVCCYNGETTIARTIDSLLQQDYPRDKFEVIVVDDGSTDHTAERIHVYTKHVRYIKLPQNKGLSEARNAGLAAARGEVYVACDDDCVVATDWLRQLATGYEHTMPAGVAGCLAELHHRCGALDQFIGVTGGGLPPLAPTDTDTAPTQRNPLQRLAAYLRGGAQTEQPTSRQVVVSELYGANGSFPVEVLQAVDGWRAEMSGIEDRDLSLRIRAHFPDRKFYAVPAAKIMHDPELTLKQFLLRPYKRGPVNFRFHRTNGITPPIFPFPVLCLLLALATAVIDYRFLPLAVLLLPQLCYRWWPTAAIRKRQLIYLTFPYFQLAEESMTIAGLARGYVVAKKNLRSTDYAKT